MLCRLLLEVEISLQIRLGDQHDLGIAIKQNLRWNLLHIVHASPYDNSMTMFLLLKIMSADSHLIQRLDIKLALPTLAIKLDDYPITSRKW